MKILFGSNYGKSIQEVDSGYLVWIIEKYEQADWSLIQACKNELSTRLKIDWHQPTEPELDLQQRLREAHQTIRTLEKRIDLFEKCLVMATYLKTPAMTIDGYLQNPKYLQQHIELIKAANE